MKGKYDSYTVTEYYSNDASNFCSYTFSFPKKWISLRYETTHSWCMYFAVFILQWHFFFFCTLLGEWKVCNWPCCGRGTKGNSRTACMVWWRSADNNWVLFAFLSQPKVALHPHQFKRLKLVYIWRLHAVKFGNNWMRKFQGLPHAPKSNLAVVGNFGMQYYYFPN